MKECSNCKHCGEVLSHLEWDGEDDRVKYFALLDKRDLGEIRLVIKESYCSAAANYVRKEVDCGQCGGPIGSFLLD